LAVNRLGELYGWGEGTLGQIGLGKRVKKVVLPVRIIRPDERQAYEEE
jgi:hypothetical protein